MRVLAWVVAVGLCAEFTRAADPPTLEQLIANLGHPQFRIRDAASRELWQRGLAAKPLLEQALASDDPEVVRRANDVLDKFRWQILPTTPEPIAKAIRDYRSTDYNRQVTAIDELLKQGDAGLNALFACLSHDFGPDRQPVLDEYALTQARKRVPTLLFENKPALAERTLELSLLSKNPEAWLDYANYHTQLGRGTEALFKLDQLDKQEPTRRDRTTLVRISGATPARKLGDGGSRRPATNHRSGGARIAEFAPRRRRTLERSHRQRRNRCRTSLIRSRCVSFCKRPARPSVPMRS